MASDGKVVISTALNNDGLEKGLKKISGSFGGLSSVLKGLTLSILSVFGAASAAVTAITKQSVEAYADWEQLTGGIATLFKQSADQIVKYAENAFLTAGLSANEYMQIVTSFSASLISSLGGDTAKAAQVANMALIDMSDNANRMGTSAELIHTAYQGFAKQNYTMLDNLKLGYGGTRSEMERLLRDAEAITGIHYDINNLSDVFNAIHVIQEKLGIAGATAEEAEKTISGSANMTKAAWKNVLIAISGGGDLDKAINNLVYSISKYFDNIVPVVQRSIAGIGQLIEKVAPQLVQTVAVALIKAIPSLLNAVYQMIIGLARGIYQGIVALFSGGSVTASISAQLNDVADTAGGAADATYEIAEATEAAGKAAKKSLAGFDELNTLADQSGSGSADMPNASFGGGSAQAAEIGGVGSVQMSPAFQAIVDKVKEFIAPLQNIDMSASWTSISNLGGALKELGGIIGTNLEWAWFNVLVPLSEWTIEEAAPACIDLLASGFSVLSAVLKPVGTGLQKLSDCLRPVGEYVQDTFLTILSTWGQYFDELATIFEEKGPEIEEIFSNLGTVFATVWEVLEPILTAQRDMWQSILNIIFDLSENKLVHFIDRLSGVSEVLSGLATGDWSQVWSGLSSLYETEMGYIEEQTKTLVEGMGLDFEEISGTVETVAANIGDFLSDAWTKVVEKWELASSWFDENVVQPIQDTFAPIEEWFGTLFENIGESASDLFYNIGVVAEGCWQVIEAVWETVSSWFDENVIQPLSKFFADTWGGVSGKAEDAWSGVEEAFDTVASFFEDTFSEAWSSIVEVFSPVGEIFEDIKDGILTAFKSVVNGLITGLNNAISVPFTGINTALGKIKDIKIVGITPFSGLKTISVPKIPYLAQGAVLPPNKPFMAVVGDQKHGTNIEAPLTTIQEAVALVMQDFISSNMAGHEATVAMLREILGAILGIQIGDDVIAAAYDRYKTKMAIVNGG